MRLTNFLLLNSLKKKFKNFSQSISLKKQIENFFTANFIEKNFENFSENPKKIFLPKKKTVTGGNAPFYPVKSDTTFHWVLIY